jgi:acetyl-CoA carboxylase biotin carboxyl carrier protein
MSDTGSGPGDIFDVRKIRRLVELMNDHELSEIDLRQADQRIRIRKGPEGSPMVYAAPQMAAPQPMHHAAAAAGQGGAAAPPPAEALNLHVIKSPMVGTYYSSSKPENPAFVKPGDSIGPETVVCIIEAMKVFNEIPAECTGRIVATLVENGDAVEFGQPLFKVDTGK